MQVGVQSNRHVKEQFKRSLLMKADVICCTLNRSGVIRK